jgi:putative NADH-flavin reductase
MKILVMGGTRFVGRPLVARLLAAGHDLTLFTRGKNPLPENIESVTGDRNDDQALAQLQGRRFDVIVDSSGRECADTRRVIERSPGPLQPPCWQGRNRSLAEAARDCIHKFSSHLHRGCRQLQPH